MKRWLLALAVILIFAAALRFGNIDHQSIWYDELDTFQRVSKLPDFLPYYISHTPGTYQERDSEQNIQTSYTGFSLIPPLHFLAIYPAAKLFSWNLVQFRYFSALFGILTVFITFLFASKLFERKTGLLAALFIAIAPYNIYFSQEARLYTMFTFLTGCLLYFFYLAHTTNKTKWWVLVGVFAALSMYTHTFSLFVFVALFIYYWIFFNKKTIKNAFITLGTLLILYSPWLSILRYQIKYGSYYSWLKAFPFLPIDIPATYIVLVLGQTLIIKESPTWQLVTVGILLFISAVLPILLLALKRIIHPKKLLRQEIFLLLILIIPILLPAGYSMWKENIYQYRYFLFATIPLFTLIAHSLRQLKPKLRTTLTILLILLLALSTFNFHTQPAKPDYKHATEYINENIQQNDVVFIHHSLSAPLLEFYDIQPEVLPLGTDHSQYMDDQDLKVLRARAQRFDRIWLVLSHSRSHSEIIESLEATGLQISDQPEFLGVRVILFER